MKIRPVAAFLVALALAQPAASEGPRPARPDVAGVSAERLDRMHQRLQAFVDRGALAGLVTLVAREGKVVDQWAGGMQDREKRQPMRPDAIFRIASMTKPVTSVAVMMLFEEGRLLLTDRLSKYIPAFGDRQVLSKAEGDAEPRSRPAKRQITLRDLLTHRSGLTYAFFDKGPVGDAYRSIGVNEGIAPTEETLADNIARLAKAPLASDPGGGFRYGLSTDVLGRVVEVVSGQPLDVFLRERIFKPLRMDDTAFVVPDEKWSRFATLYRGLEEGGIRPMAEKETFDKDEVETAGNYRAPGHLFSGGAGLTSTASDYARFLQMLLNGGELDGVRLLSPKTVGLMTVSHTRDLPAVGPGWEFGLGFGIVTDVGATQNAGSPGSYFWGGLFGTSFWVDPKEKLIGVLMTQRYPENDVKWNETFHAMVYQSLVR